MPESAALARPKSLSAARAAALILAGAIQTLAFAPWYYWPATLVSFLVLVPLCLGRSSGALFRDGWLVGFGLFGAGASWVYVSISEYGMTSAPLAATLTLIFVAGLALFHAIGFWCWGRLGGDSRSRQLWLFPAVWVLIDWVRGWLFTGFPWLYAGTAQVDGPLAGWLPLLGVHGATLLTVATAILLIVAVDRLRTARPQLAAAATGITLIPWIAGPLLQPLEWTEPDGEPLDVAAIQGNISQHDKWDPARAQEQIRIYQQLSEPHWERDLILWPETAIPATQKQATAVLAALDKHATETDTAVVTGIAWHGDSPRYPGKVFHNSLTTAGNARGVYHKQRLVPFGEYVPFQSLLRGTIEFFNLPMSVFRPGPQNQQPLRLAGVAVHPFICYEITYPDFVARNTNATGFLLTVSNDAWFGRSIGPFQHQQIARTRSVETGRALLRGTNNGITAIVDRNGAVSARASQYERDSLAGSLQPVTGRTPFMMTGSWPVLTLAAVTIVFTRRRKR